MTTNNTLYPEAEGLMEAIEADPKASAEAALQADERAHLEKCLHGIINRTATIAMLKNEAARLKARAEAVERQLAGVKEHVRLLMALKQITKMKTAFGTLSYRVPKPRVEIVDRAASLQLYNDDAAIIKGLEAAGLLEEAEKVGVVQMYVGYKIDKRGLTELAQGKEISGLETITGAPSVTVHGLGKQQEEVQDEG